MKKVLVVGGAGYVGGHLVDLLTTCHSVRVFDNLLYEDSYLKDVEFIRGDVTNIKQLRPHLDWADTVVWLAAFVGDPACAVNPELTMDVNVKSVENLVKNFDGKIIFTSTCSVYGAQSGELTEESDVSPLSIYANSKLIAENILLKRGNCLILRLGTLFGVSDRSARLRVDLVVNVLTIRAKFEGKISIFGGDQFRPLLHVKDVGRLIFSQVESENSGVYNLHSENLSMRGLANLIYKVIPSVKIQYTDSPFQDTRNYRVSSLKAKNTLGFSPDFAVADGITELSRLVDSGRITNFANPRYTNVDIILLKEKR